MRHRPRRGVATVQTLLCGGVTSAALLLLAGLGACAGGPGSSVQIDWVNVVQFGGIQYLAASIPSGRAPTAADVGPMFATVQFKLADNVHDPNYHLKDGDAAYLDAGTPVYRVPGYAPSFRLVARFANRLTFYEADTNPHARTGADLLDISSKVRSIGVNSPQDGTTELGVLTNPTQVEALVAMVLSAPVDQQVQERDSATYFIAFHLNDGTAVTRAYWLSSGELGRGMLLPPDFGEAVRHAVAARSAG